MQATFQPKSLAEFMAITAVRYAYLKARELEQAHLTEENRTMRAQLEQADKRPATKEATIFNRAGSAQPCAICNEPFILTRPGQTICEQRCLNDFRAFQKVRRQRDAGESLCPCGAKIAQKKGMRVREYCSPTCRVRYAARRLRSRKKAMIQNA